MKHLLALLLLAFLGACAPKSIDEYNTAESEEEIVRLLNEREYAKAVWLVESKHGRSPADKKVAFLLGQAYLGKAGFEPLAVAARVSQAQRFSSPDALDLFPDCSEEALGEKPQVVCVLKRVYLHTPQADMPDLKRARELFRYAYPSAKESPEWVNVLIGMVESASCVKRAGGIYLFAKRLGESREPPSDADLRWLIHQASQALRETSETLKRAEHSGNKITQLLTGDPDMQWFQQAKNGLEWVEEAGLATLFNTLRDTFLEPSDEAKYKETLDRIRELLEEQEKKMRPV